MKHVRRNLLLLITGVLLVTQTILGNIVANQLQAALGSWASYVLPTFLLLTVLLLGYTLWQDRQAQTDSATSLHDQRQGAFVSGGTTYGPVIGDSSGPVNVSYTINAPPPTTPTEDRNRRAMIDLVRNTWIEGVLKKSLYREVRLELSLHQHAEAVAPPLGLYTREFNHQARSIPSGTPIISVFEQFSGALLILGAPGAGKTTLLLELAQDLLHRADTTPTHPIPVIFPLSSWAQTRKPLVNWLTDELQNRYFVPSKLAEQWIATDSILPLLDGLDEVASEHRAACVDAINTFRQTHGLLPLAVCSRIADYESLSVKLSLQGAVIAQPLQTAEVAAYLDTIGLASPDPQSPIWELLTTPLMLNIAVLTYAGQPSAAGHPLHLPATSDELFATYVERMFARRTPTTYTRQQTMRWLSWLAWQMQHHQQTVFYLENMQPSWLPSRLSSLSIVSAGLLARLLAGLLLALFMALLAGIAIGLSFALGASLLIGVYLTLRGHSSEISSVDIVHWSWTGFRTALWATIRRGLGFGIVAGLIFGLVAKLVLVLNNDLVNLLLRYQFIEIFYITSVRVVIGLGGALKAGLIFGVVVAVLVTLGFGLFSGWSSTQIPIKAVPNQGIWNSAKNALIMGLIVGLIFGISYGLLAGVVFYIVDGLIVGLLNALLNTLVSLYLVGVIAGLQYGGLACLQHFVLRLIITHNSTAPWHYVPFLDFAADRIFLRKVGGGYIFIHRMLLDYFAKQYTGPETNEQRASSQGK